MKLIQTSHGVALDQKLVAEVREHIQQHGIAQASTGLYQVMNTKHDKPVRGNVGVSIEELTLRTFAHGVQAQEYLSQQFCCIERILFLLVILISFLHHIVQVGHDGIVRRLECVEIRIVIHTASFIQPLQHQFNGVDVSVREIFVGPEYIFQE